MPHLPSALHIRPDQIGAVAFGVVATVGVVTYIFWNRRPSAEEVERQRREFLATRGRITDAMLIDTGLDRRVETEPTGLNLEDSTPDVLRYQYKVGGVGYESLQDVARLPEHVRHLRVDLPIQVRYDPKNPGNSIVVAESWSGLRVGLGSGVSATKGKGLQERLHPRD
ncbi:hypothetical protein HDF16_002996 [Granulicella aggregans]|uniref:DUF3592 domain-containing protein n=1 Tax=Granulicella aggregans TaxID=474949 RepID=A0A7W7ZEF8_9BACT|nr:DUF3592 domain-containing protein [Granulicella aggregans]MBB5058282.1 hypothetical protein [Granulicella aggregans]